MRILHLDDDRILSAGIARMLRRDGHHVLSVTSPQLAIAVLRAGDVDLCISDFNVDPHLTGADVLAAAGDVPFIFISSDDRAGELGVLHLNKPASRDAIREAIAATTARKAA